MQEYKLDLAYLLRILTSMDLPFVALFILIRFLTRDQERRETPSIASWLSSPADKRADFTLVYDRRYDRLLDAHVIQVANEKRSYMHRL